MPMQDSLGYSSLEYGLPSHHSHGCLPFGSDDSGSETVNSSQQTSVFVLEVGCRIVRRLHMEVGMGTFQATEHIRLNSKERRIVP